MYTRCNARCLILIRFGCVFYINFDRITLLAKLIAVGIRCGCCFIQYSMLDLLVMADIVLLFCHIYYRSYCVHRQRCILFKVVLLSAHHANVLDADHRSHTKCCTIRWIGPDLLLDRNIRKGKLQFVFCSSFSIWINPFICIE